jgi:hypothetical protein
MMKQQWGNHRIRGRIVSKGRAGREMLRALRQIRQGEYHRQ